MELDGVPIDEVASGLPSAHVVELAERDFLGRIDDLFPEHHVLVWEARWASLNGPALSRYEVYAR